MSDKTVQNTETDSETEELSEQILAVLNDANHEMEVDKLSDEHGEVAVGEFSDPNALENEFNAQSTLVEHVAGPDQSFDNGGTHSSNSSIQTIDQSFKRYKGFDGEKTKNEENKTKTVKNNGIDSTFNEPNEGQKRTRRANQNFNLAAQQNGSRRNSQELNVGVILDDISAIVNGSRSNYQSRIPIQRSQTLSPSRQSTSSDLAHRSMSLISPSFTGNTRRQSPLREIRFVNTFAPIQTSQPPNVGGSRTLAPIPTVRIDASDIINSTSSLNISDQRSPLNQRSQANQHDLNYRNQNNVDDEDMSSASSDNENVNDNIINAIDRRDQAEIDAEVATGEIERAMVEFNEFINRSVNNQAQGVAAPASRMQMARARMSNRITRDMMSVLRVLESRAIIIHPVIFPDIAFTNRELNEVEELIRAYNDTFLEEDDTHPLNSIITFIRHYGTTIAVCTTTDMMTNIMSLNLEPAEDRNFRPVGEPPCTFMLRRFSNSFFNSFISFSTTNQLCYNSKGEAMLNIARSLIRDFNPIDWSLVGYRRGFDAVQGRVILEYCVTIEEIQAIRNIARNNRAQKFMFGGHNYFIRMATDRFKENNINVRIVAHDVVISRLEEDLKLIYDPTRGVLSEIDEDERKRREGGGNRKRTFRDD